MEDSGHTSAWAGQSVERTKRNGKRIFSVAFKFWIVEEARRPGVSIAALAMQNGINPNQLHRWIRLPHWRRDGTPSPSAPVLLPVTIEAEPLLAASMQASAPVKTAALAPPIEIELGGAIVRVPSGSDAATLRTVLAALRG